MEWLDNNLKTSKSAKVFKQAYRTLFFREIQAYRTHLKTGGRPSAEPAGDHDNLGQAPKITDSSVKPLLEFSIHVKVNVTPTVE